MARSKTSKRWLDEHFHDEFVHMAKAQGLRSRAAFKLLEIQQKDKLIKPGMIVIDLGAAPGGWSQVAAGCVGEKGKVIALDRLAMPSLAGVDFIQGDFTEDAVLAQLLSHMGEQKADIIISDMAPNTSGIESVDIPASMYLCELALALADDVLKPGGSLLIKVFQGAGIEELRKEIKEKFQKLITRKPKASRSRSKEAYLLATGYNL